MFECVFNNGKEISNPVVRKSSCLSFCTSSWPCSTQVLGGRDGLPEHGHENSRADKEHFVLLLVGIYHDSDATCYFGSEMATPQRWWVFGMVDCVYRSRGPSFLSSIICDSFPSNTGIEITIGLTTYCQLIGPNIDRHNGKHSRAHHQIL